MWVLDPTIAERRDNQGVVEIDKNCKRVLVVDRSFSVGAKRLVFDPAPP